MCGIAGIFNFDGKKVERKTLHRMDEVMVHRGPDGHGELIEDNIGLANRRLAIIDPTAAGRQPMGTKDNSLWITFNGEIFNYKELREDLIKKGYNFHSNTDTETILYGYKHYGENFVKKLIGQFAFCIWDKNKKRFFLARDHLGINPLFYAKLENTFLFASEVKGILSSGLVRREINNEALHHFLSVFRIPLPLTIFKEIKGLLPGHTMVVDNQGMKIKKFWEIPVGLWEREEMDIKKIKEKLRETLISCVSYASIADVPVAAFLSGGIDSSLVVALLAQQSSKKIKTFSLWSEGGETYDERKYSTLIAKKYNTDHTDFTVSQEELIRDFPKIIYYFDQPTGGSMETYFISKYVSKEAKVALCGIGGDELFSGYHAEIYKTLNYITFYKFIPKKVKNTLLNLLNLLPLSPNFKKTLEIGNRLLSASSPLKQVPLLYFTFQEEEKRKLYNRSLFLKMEKFDSNKSIVDKLIKEIKSRNLIDQLAYFDLKSYTRDDLLLGTNMMSMANGLEVRVPLLDPRLVKMSALISPHLKYRNGITKFILKEVAKEWLPAEILNHKKTGFALPRMKYMKEKLKPFIMTVLSKESIKKRGIFDPDYVQQYVVNKFYNDPSTKALWSEHLRVWTLFIFELWCRIHLDQRNVTIPSVSLSDLS